MVSVRRAVDPCVGVGRAGAGVSSEPQPLIHPSQRCGRACWRSQHGGPRAGATFCALSVWPWCRVPFTALRPVSQPSTVVRTGGGEGEERYCSQRFPFRLTSPSCPCPCPLSPRPYLPWGPCGQQEVCPEPPASAVTSCSPRLRPCPSALTLPILPPLPLSQPCPRCPALRPSQADTALVWLTPPKGGQLVQNSQLFCIFKTRTENYGMDMLFFVVLSYL